MPEKHAQLRRFLRAFGLCLGLVLFVVTSQSLALPALQDGPSHFDTRPVVLHLASPRLAPAKAERNPGAPHPAAVLPPLPASLPAAPLGVAAILMPQPLLRVALHLPTGWQARAPPNLDLQSRP